MIVAFESALSSEHTEWCTSFYHAKFGMLHLKQMVSNQRNAKPLNNSKCGKYLHYKCVNSDVLSMRSNRGFWLIVYGSESDHYEATCGIKVLTSFSLCAADAPTSACSVDTRCRATFYMRNFSGVVVVVVAVVSIRDKAFASDSRWSMCNCSLAINFTFSLCRLITIEILLCIANMYINVIIKNAYANNYIRY